MNRADSADTRHSPSATRQGGRSSHRREPRTTPGIAGEPGWSPPARPPSTRLQHVADRIFPRSGVGCALYLVAVIALLSLAPHLSIRADLAADGLAALAAGSWCLANFGRCRQAHCLIDGSGWLILAVLAFTEAGLGRSVIGGSEQAVFLGLLVVALVFEFVWRLTHGTNAIIRRDERSSRWRASN